MYEGSDTTDEESRVTPQTLVSAQEQSGKQEILVISDSEDEGAVRRVTKELPRTLKRRASVTGIVESLDEKTIKRPEHVRPTTQTQSGQSTDNTSRDCESATLAFPHGAIRHSQVEDRHSPMSISKDDLFCRHASPLRAMLLSFLIDFDFLATLFKRELKLEIITEDANVPGPIKRDGWTIQRRQSMPFQCIHSKVFLIEGEDYMRVIVSTANLIPIDFDNLDNVFYIHDFPKHQTDQTTTPLGHQLERLLTDNRIESDIVKAIRQTDFSSSRITLICSKPGTFYGELPEHEYGQLALARAVLESDIESGDDFIAEHCTSSIGNLNVPWIQTFRDSLSGRKSSSTVNPDNTKVIYPSMKDVESSTRYGADNITLSHNIVCNGRSSDPSWPAHLFFGYQSSRFGTLFHAKTNLVHDGATPKFLVFGSHNFSQAAWGNVTVQGPRARYKGLKTVMANYEVSVFIPGHLLTDQHLLPTGVDWKRVVTYQLDDVKRYDSGDRPWTVRFFT